MGPPLNQLGGGTKWLAWRMDQAEDRENALVNEANASAKPGRLV